MSLASAIFGSNDFEKAANNGSHNGTSSLFAKRSTDASINDASVSKSNSKQKKRRRAEKEKETDESTENFFSTLSREEILAQRKLQSKSPLVDQLTCNVHDNQGEPEEAISEEVSGLVKLYGFAVIQNALVDETVLTQLSQEARACRQRICQALEAKGLTWNSEVNNTQEIRFHEAVVRCQGRMDVRYDFGRNENHSEKSVEKSPFWQSHSLLHQVVSNLLWGGAEEAAQPKLVYAGWIFSFPGSADQPWHQDGMPLFGPDSNINQELSTYAINVFVPIDDTTLELGPTEFVVHSHRQSTKVAMAQTRSNDSGDGVSAVINPLPQRGDMLLYDYRICHRGTANLHSNEDSTNKKNKHEKHIRSVLYLMYARPWFQEHINFGTEQLFQSNKSAPAASPSLSKQSNNNTSNDTNPPKKKSKRKGRRKARKINTNDHN